jgi:hypothetical protein
MSQPRRRKAQGRQAQNRGRKPISTRDFWGRDDPDEEPPELIRPSEDPTAMIRSLGPPPLPGRETVSEHYFAAVYDKAASLAIALAAASSLLDMSEEEEASPSPV